MSATRPLYAAFALFALTFSAACGSDGGGGTTGPAGTGNLVITITPAGTAPASAHVSGAAGYSQSLAVTTTLSGIPVGTYSVTADSAELPDTISGATVFAGRILGSPATVAKDATAHVSVSYDLAHLRGALWMASPENEAVIDFGVDHLRSEGSVAAPTNLFGLLPNGIAINATGLMWVSSLAEDTLRAFTFADRSGIGGTPSSHKLQSPSLGTPEQIAFDRNGTLWVADYANGLFGFTAAQLTVGGNGITPAVHLTDTSSVNPGMQSVAIDGNGNAWVAEALANQVVKFSVAQLATSGSKAPAVRLTGNFNDPVDLTFDSHQNLWVANARSGVLMYTPAQIASSGAPVSTTGLSTPEPQALAFDSNGSIWVSNALNATIDVYSASSLIPGPATLVERISPNLGASEVFSVGKLAFDPWIVAARAPSGSIVQDRTLASVAHH